MLVVWHNSACNAKECVMTKIPQIETKSCEQSSACSIDIHIESKGDVNIYNCSTPEPPSPPSSPCEECPPAQTATGACVPLGLGAKPKQSQHTKLQHLLATSPVPSALAASYIQLSRRFLAGKTAANPLEVKVFSSMKTLSPELRSVLSCTINSFDAVSKSDRDRLFLSTLTADLNTPIDPITLAEAVGQEIAQRTSFQIFGDPGAVEQERPGKNRFFDNSGDEIPRTQIHICRVNGLRTNEFTPELGPGDYEPEEIQQHCEAVLVGTEVQLNCEDQVGNCPGNSLPGDICQTVPEIEAGTGVILEGVNYISVDATVRLAALAPGTATAEVDAHVVGDIDTPLHEIINGAQELIRDCRVHDRLTFRLPADLPPGTYTCTIAMPNDSGFLPQVNIILSNPQFLKVIPPATARFQIALETLIAREETSPAFFGSDEVGLSIISAALLTDGTTSDLQVLKGEDNKDFLRFGDVDSGDSFSPNRTLFVQHQPMIAMAMTVNGYEIDSEDAFEKQIQSSMDVFVDILEKEWGFVKQAIDAAGGYKALLKLGLPGYVAIGIAALITLGIDIVVALWAPADPIMHDAVGFTTADLAALTNANFPLPAATEFNATEDIKVKVAPLNRLSQQFGESREYSSSEEESRYELKLRYNRIA
jgi:hypothetical protein